MAEGAREIQDQAFQFQPNEYEDPCSSRFALTNKTYRERAAILTGTEAASKGKDES